MGDFIRARSDEQKALRMEEIKAAADRQFAAHPYHEITLTTIADELSWSRANLYKYVTTKEEIFLALAKDKYSAYADALLAAFPEGAKLKTSTVAEVWAGIIVAHKEWFKLHDILLTIIETNVSFESLKEYKGCYYNYVAVFKPRFAEVFGLPENKCENLLLAVNTYATTLLCSCGSSPIVKQALAELGVKKTPVDPAEALDDFIGMCLEHWCK